MESAGKALSGTDIARRSPDDYVPVLLAAVARLEPYHDGKVRRAIYERAHQVLFSHMCAARRTLSGDEIRLARAVLDQAIAQVENAVSTPEWPATRHAYARALPPELTPADPPAAPDSEVPPEPVQTEPLPSRPGLEPPVLPAQDPPAELPQVPMQEEAPRTELERAGPASSFPVSQPLRAATAQPRSFALPADQWARRFGVPAAAAMGIASLAILAIIALPQNRAPSVVAPPAALPVDAREVAAISPPEEADLQDDPDRLIAELDAAIRTGPTSVAYRDRGAAFLRKGDARRAIADLDAAVQRDHHDAMAYRWRGAAFVEIGLPDRAIADFTRAIGLATVEGGHLSQVELARVYLARAALYDIKGLFDRESLDLGKAITTAASAPANARPNLLATAYRRRANVYLQGGRRDRALADLTAAIAADPEHAAGTYLDRARLLQSLGEVDPAVADLRRALALDPHNGEARDALAKAGAL
jgi:tetratricopeptide (TPR) repeat protein